MLTVTDLQYILNKIPVSGYKKAFNNAALFFNHVKVRASKKGHIVLPFHYAGNSGGGSYGEGDDLDSTGKQSRRMLNFPWARVYKAVSIDGLAQAIAKNGGVYKINDLIKDEVFHATKDLIKDIDTQMKGAGTGNSGKDMKGIQYHIADSGNYGNENLARETYAWLASYVNDNGGVKRSLSKALIRDVHNTLVDDRGVSYNQIWTNSTLYDAYEDLLGDKARYVQIKIGDLFFKTLMIKDRPVIPFPGYPSRMDFVEADEFYVEYLEQEAKNSLGEVAKGMFKVEQLPTSKDAKDFAVMVYLNFVCANPYCQGSLQDIE